MSGTFDHGTFIGAYDNASSDIIRATSVLRLALNTLIGIAQNEGAQPSDWAIIGSLEAAENILERASGYIRQLDDVRMGIWEARP